MYLCSWYHLALNISMAKVGYIFKAAGYDGFDTDREWMEQYGCVQVIEEENGHEKHTAIPLARMDCCLKYDITSTPLIFLSDFTLNKPLHIRLLLIYGCKGKYKSLYNNT